MHARGDFQIPENDLAGDFYELTQTIMEDAGMPAYEISNHAAAGQESRHNMVYWRYGDYAGVGPGAHGRLTLEDGARKIATRAHSAPEIWLERVGNQGHGAHPYEDLSREQRFTEAMMMGLRLRDGVSLANIGGEAGTDWQNLIDRKRLKALSDEGLLVLDGDILRPTMAGMQRLNGVLGYLLT
jgi:oxygen-independent coproporphyrinogen-3 oxidase